LKYKKTDSTTKNKLNKIDLQWGNFAIVPC